MSNRRNNGLRRRGGEIPRTAGDELNFEPGEQAPGGEAGGNVTAAPPEAREDRVARARRLIADANYPPKEVLDSVAGLLAQHIDKSADE